MNKTFFITLGWSETPALTSITRHGLGERDRVIFVIPDWKDEGAKAALSDLKTIIAKISNKIIVEEFAVAMGDVELATVALARRMREEAEEGRRLILNLSGGMRLLVVEALLAAILSGVRAIRAEVQTENRRLVAEIPPLWSLTPDLRKPEVAVLAAVKGSPLPVKAVARRCGLPLATVYRLVLRLERLGALKTERVGRERMVAPTGVGKLLAEL